MNGQFDEVVIGYLRRKLLLFQSPVELSLLVFGRFQFEVTAVFLVFYFCPRSAANSAKLEYAFDIAV